MLRFSFISNQMMSLWSSDSSNLIFLLSLMPQSLSLDFHLMTQLITRMSNIQNCQENQQMSYLQATLKFLSMLTKGFMRIRKLLKDQMLHLKQEMTLKTIAQYTKSLVNHTRTYLNFILCLLVSLVSSKPIIHKRLKTQ